MDNKMLEMIFRVTKRKCRGCYREFCRLPPYNACDIDHCPEILKRKKHEIEVQKLLAKKRK